MLDAMPRSRSPLVANAALLGFGAAHLLPHWFSFSQPFGAAGARILSGVSLARTIAAATGPGVVWLRLVRRPGERAGMAGGVS
jgi:hypothetical protein